MFVLCQYLLVSYYCESICLVFCLGCHFLTKHFNPGVWDIEIIFNIYYKVCTIVISQSVLHCDFAFGFDPNRYTFDTCVLKRIDLSKNWYSDLTIVIDVPLSRMSNNSYSFMFTVLSLLNTVNACTNVLILSVTSFIRSMVSYWVGETLRMT